MFLVHLLNLLVHAAGNIWSAGNVDQFMAAVIAWGSFTVLICCTVYLPIAGAKIFLGVKSKTMDKVLKGTIIVNALLAVAPVILVPGICCGFPSLLLFWIGRAMLRGNRRQPRRNPRPAPRPRREAEDEDDADSDGEEDADTES